MRFGLSFLVLVCACYSESTGWEGVASAEEATGSPCTPGTESCACAPGGECDSGLVCANAQCSRPMATTTVAESTGTSGETSASGPTETSIATSTTGTSSSSEVGSSDAGSSDADSTGSVCDGDCLECYSCAIAGPCADESAACEGGGCGNTPFCMMSCAQQLSSCAQCCDDASLALAVDLVECFAAQCGLDCGFRC